MKQNKLPPLIGVLLSDAMQTISKCGYSFRYISCDGRIYALDSSKKQKRINLKIENGVVVGYEFF